MAAVVVSPWVIRNQRVFGKPIVTTTHGGYTLWLGNNVAFYAWLAAPLKRPLGLPIGPFEREEFQTRKRNIQEWTRDGKCRTGEWMIDEIHISAGISHNKTTQYVWTSCLYRVGQLWSPLPNRLTAEESTGRRLLRYAVAGWYCGVYLLAAVGIWRLRWKLFKSPWVWGVLFAWFLRACTRFIGRTCGCGRR